MTLVTIPALAQDEQDDESSLLPEIDPQDIEIRSEFQARFPGLNRQPILGFEPEPRVYQIDPNRMPFMETEEQIIADLPVSELTRPTPPQFTPLEYNERINALARIGMGSYISPEAQFWGVKRLSSSSYVGGDLDYISSDGHLDSQESSFRSFEANGDYATKIGSKTRLDFTGGVQSDFNQMFNVNAISDDARKDYTGFHLGGELQHFQNRISGWNAGVNLRYYEATLSAEDFIADALDPSGESNELIYNASLSKRWTGPNVNETIAIKAGVKGGEYEGTDPFSESWLTGQAGAEYERLFNYSTKVTADLSVFYGKDYINEQIYLGPSLKVEYPFFEGLSLSAKVGAEPFVRTVERLHTNNRFLNISNELQHSYKMYGWTEAEFDFSTIGSLTMGVEYENISDYPMYVRDVYSTPIGSEQPLFYTTSYTDIYKVKAYVGASHQFMADRFWVHGQAYVQSPQVQNGGRIPFEERLGFTSTLGFRPLDQITIKAWADYTGARETSRIDEELGGYFLLGGRLDVYLTDRIGAYIKMKNLLNQDYQIWTGYTERPFQAYGGVTIKL